MKSIIIKEMKIMIKEKGNLFFLIIMPIMFIVLFSSVFGNIGDSSMTVHYVDQDHSKASKEFLHHIDQIDGFEIKHGDSSLDSQVQQIKDGDMSSLLVIPQRFGQAIQSEKQQTNVKFYRDATASQATAPIQAVLQNITNRYQKHKLSSTLTAMGKSNTEVKSILQPPINIKNIQESGSSESDVTMVQQVVPGYTVMFVFFIMITMIRRFFKEKESGMVSRLRSTPMNPMVYLIGMWVPAFISVLIQCTVLLAFGHFVYNLHLGDLSAIMVLVLCLAFGGTGIGLALSMIVKGETQGLAITQMFALGGAVIGGLWFPIELMPQFIQTISRFIPQFWAQQGLLDVMVHSAHIKDVWLAMVVLLAFGTAGMLVALLRFKHFLRTANS